MKKYSCIIIILLAVALGCKKAEYQMYESGPAYKWPIRFPLPTPSFTRRALAGIPFLFYDYNWWPCQ